MESPPEMMPEIEQLPRSLKEIALVIGVKDTVKLSRAFDGSRLYIPSVDHLERRIRNTQIRAEYDRGFATVVQLSRKFGLSTRQVEKILSSPGCG